MNNLVIGLVLIVAWYVCKMIYEIGSEIVMSNLHAADWYAVLCKKKPKMPKNIMEKIKESSNESAPYKGSAYGFMARR
jgi:hypothetical protein